MHGVRTVREDLHVHMSAADLAAGDDRKARVQGVAASGELVADHRELFGGSADEHDPGPLARLRQARALGQEPVARVDRVRTDGSRRGHDRLHVEVARGRRWRPKADNLIGEARRHGREIRLGRAQHGLDAQPVAGANDPDRDLAPVGDQQTADNHGTRMPRPRMRPSIRSVNASGPA
jgi:hypothetical protein